MEQRDIIIIGAGIAGLTAAHTLKARRMSYGILEASDRIGGRAATLHTQSGVPVDLGAHWLHGKGNPLKDMLSQYGLKYREDKADRMWVYQAGKREKTEASDWIDEAVDSEKAQRILKGEAPDCTIPDLAAHEEARKRLTSFSRMWDGLTPPLMPSAKEFLTDKNTPGGLQICGGVGALTEKLARDIGWEHIHFNTPVTRIQTVRGGVIAHDDEGRQWKASRVLFTGSLGVIKQKRVAFDPPISAGLSNQLARIVMGDMNKIVLEIDPMFLQARRIPENLSLELLDDYPHFCHVHGAGSPLISLFIAGPRASEIEGFSPQEAIDYAVRVLSPVEELATFEDHIVGEPIVTRWSGNPFTCGSYSACIPGGERSWPRQEGPVFFCGDAFDKQFPSSMAGAARSGKAAALMAIEALEAEAHGTKRIA